MSKCFRQKHYPVHSLLSNSKWIKISWLFFLLILQLPLYAQSIPKGSISGNVIDATTTKPLYCVNVFLNNTTLGCATDKNGHYTIENIPLGTYTLVASMMGYELKKQQIQLKDSAVKVVHFELQPKVIVGETVSITAETPRQWKKDL